MGPFDRKPSHPRTPHVDAVTWFACTHQVGQARSLLRRAHEIPVDLILPFSAAADPAQPRIVLGSRTGHTGRVPDAENSGRRSLP